MRHRDSWAVEERAPSEQEARAAEAKSEAGRAVGEASPAARPAPSPAGQPQVARTPRRIIAGSSKPSADTDSADAEILVVMSKLKDYIRVTSGLKTADAVAKILSDHVRELCDRAVEKAQEADRKTVLERDFPRVSSFR